MPTFGCLDRSFSLDKPKGIILKFSLALFILLYVKVELSQYKLLLIGKIMYFRENAYSSFFFWLCEILLSYNPTSGRQRHHKKHLKETGLRDGNKYFDKSGYF